jgi:hypothetical protein
VAELSPEESNFLQLLLYMTGREDRLSRDPLLQKEQIVGIKNIWPRLKGAKTGAMEPTVRCDLLNRALLGLGVNPVCFEFFEIVFGDLDFSDSDRFKERVNRFRALCMLKYGNFRFGYKKFRNNKLISDEWRTYFPSDHDITERARQMRGRLEPVGLVPIPPSQLFSLGYLASEHAPKINGARKQLQGLINKALQERANDFDALRSIAKKMGVEGLTDLLAKAGIPGTEMLIYSDTPLFGGGKKTYSEILMMLQEGCITVDEEAIRKAREDGLQNARTYLSVQDLDVYVATSMREPLHFTTNWNFIRRLFHSGKLAEWHLRYFDPTQAFLEDRIQKGLLECLMIKRTSLTVYNAQEADTFGKDAEAGVTLAQRKPVIVYVARLFEQLEDLRNLYKAIDEGKRTERDLFVESLVKQGFIEGERKDLLLGPEKTKADAVKAVIEKHASKVLEKLGDEKVAVELIRQGYDPEGTGSTLIKYAVEKIQKLERRALTFRDVHPLSLQTSPIDGVARGIIVTRTIEDTAEVVSGIFLGTLEYYIEEDNSNWLLVDRITGSPVRVVTKDHILTTAFWSENWGAHADQS